MKLPPTLTRLHYRIARACIGPAQSRVAEPATRSVPPARALAAAEELAGRGFVAAAGRLARRAPPSPRAAVLAGRGAEPALDPDRRAALWRDLAHRHPENATLAQLQATALADALDYRGAMALADAAMARQPARPGPARARFRLAERTGALGEALALARRFAAEQPGEAMLAQEVLRLERAAGVASRGGGGATLDARAEAAHRIARDGPEAALPHLEAAFAASASASDAAALANGLLLAGHVERGSAEVARFGARFAGDPRFPLKQAQLAERDGDHQAALAAFTRAVDRDPALAAARAGVARSLIYLGRFAPARRWLGFCRSAGDLGFWADPLAAFLEQRAGRRAAAQAAMARAYHAGERHLAAYRHWRARDPQAVYLPDGRSRRHPSPRAAASLALWDGFLAALQSGGAVLVGNSPRLIGRGLGPEIDNGRPVIRLNDFRLAGFTGDVGSRTDVWFSSANRQADPDRRAVAGATAFLQQPHAQHFPELPAFSRGRMSLDLDPARAGFLPPHVHALSDALLYPVPTTGMRVILVLEFLCQAPVAAFGFDFFASAAMHYFDEGPTRLRVGESHAVQFERDFASEVLGEIGRFVRFR